MGKEREGNINMWLPLVCLLLGTWPATKACALTGNRTGDPLVHRPVLNPLSRTSQGYHSIFFWLPLVSDDKSSVVLIFLPLNVMQPF